ncbi:TPA: glycosyltransferase family 2 protein [Legionella feeleii]|uniref:Glycosyltransferase, group 2 family protein (Glycan biosynthesis) n=1 Tax=Legionella feeleii TaxID=453 RepID=A0A378J139_9GAMM|nr:glycosyltransferase family 2 protein [Legionella feeleii]STX38014.1 glycosyltransferase, group 2 family protein (glycan biosynthesis) [Legionella feeleii]
MTSMQVALSIIIPVYNEVDNVEPLYEEIVATLSATDFPYEVIFVDDGSKDGTVEKLYSLSQRYSNFRVVYHKRNFGQSAAFLSGAKAARYALLVTLDGDGQNDPADIPRLVEQVQDFRTVVLGNRKKRDDNYLRKLSSRIGNSVRQRLLHDGCPDTGCSLKLFPREAFLALPHFNHLHRFLPALFKRAGFKLVNLPVNHRPRRHGVSKYGVMNRLFVGIHDLIGVRWLLKRPCAPEVSTHER